MKFLNVYCEDRKEEVYINIEKIVMITKLADADECRIDLEGSDASMVRVATSAEDLIKKINGEDKVAVGFRTGR